MEQSRYIICSDEDFILIIVDLTFKATIDGVEYKAKEHAIYKGVMLDNIPNCGFVFGYTNASWTLKADIASYYFTQMLNYMRANKIVKLMPVVDPGEDFTWSPFSGGLTAGYIARAAPVVPKVGDKEPWSGGCKTLFNTLHNLSTLTLSATYLKDLFNLSVKSFSPDSLQLVYSDKKKN